MTNNEWITLISNCDAKLIPTGIPISLIKGTFVQITQDKGDTVTVQVNGNLARIAGKDRAALGLEPSQTPKINPNKICTGPVDESLVWEQLKTCYDPEISVNIVDLGLIYECLINNNTEKPGSDIVVRMTLTAPACGMGPVLADEIETKLLTLDNVSKVTVELVFDPPWSTDKMSDSAKLTLGLL